MATETDKPLIVYMCTQCGALFVTRMQMPLNTPRIGVGADRWHTRRGFVQEWSPGVATRKKYEQAINIPCWHPLTQVVRPDVVAAYLIGGEAGFLALQTGLPDPDD